MNELPQNGITSLLLPPTFVDVLFRFARIFIRITADHFHLHDAVAKMLMVRNYYFFTNTKLIINHDAICCF